MEIFAGIEFFLSDFINPKKRVFVGYLLIAVAIAAAWLMISNRHNCSVALRKIFDRKIFFSRSSIADYKLFILNRVFSFLFAPILVSQIAFSTAIYFMLMGTDWLPQGIFQDVGRIWVVVLFTTTSFVADDFSKYLVHRWMHKWPLLWAIHKVHHSAESLTPITVYRVHPLEGILYTTRGTIAQGLIIPLFLFFFGAGFSIYTVVGANIFNFVFHVTGSNLRHSHVAIRYWPWLERILISPAQHQIHHSVEERHYDKNFGAALSIWDWAFGSLHFSEAGNRLQYGLDAREKMEAGSITSLYIQPIREMLNLVIGYILQIFKLSNWVQQKLKISVWNSIERVEQESLASSSIRKRVTKNE